MSDRDGGGVAAALALGAIVALIAGYVAWSWGLTSWQRVDADRSAYQRAGYAEEYIERTCVMVDRVALIKCIQEAVESAREDQRSGYDLKAQENMASWAWWLLMTSVATVFVAGVGIYYVRATLVETRRAVHKELRAYISFTPIHTDFASVKVIGQQYSRLFDGKITIFMRSALKNTGQTPATDVRVGLECYTCDTWPEFDADAIYHVNAATFVGSIGPNSTDEADLTAEVKVDGDRIASGQQNIIFAGVMEYKDFLGTTCETKFTGFYPRLRDAARQIEAGEAPTGKITFKRVGKGNYIK